jgi:hypothetical protein
MESIANFPKASNYIREIINMADINLNRVPGLSIDNNITGTTNTQSEVSSETDPSAAILSPQDTRVEGIEEPPPNSPEALAKYAKENTLPKAAGAFFAGKTLKDKGRRKAIGEKEKEALEIEADNEELQKQINLKKSQKKDEGFLGYKFVPSRMSLADTFIAGGAGFCIGGMTILDAIRSGGLFGQPDPITSMITLALSMLPAGLAVLMYFLKFGVIQKT